MKRQWDAEELVENFTLLPSEMALLENKSEENRVEILLPSEILSDGSKISTRQAGSP
jgi:hypothetical protein